MEESKDGQKKMWERPWTSAEMEKRPWIDNFDLGDGVDVLRGSWVEEHGAMVLTLRTWDGKERT